MDQPIVLSTWKFGSIANDAAWPVLAVGGGSLDAVEAAARAVEADPDVDSVGLGGLPDRSGRVSLDACIMQSPARCGAVCHVRRFTHPVTIARWVMERTQHVMLAGEGAERFAESQGMAPAEPLTERAADAWRRWKQDNPEAAADPTVPWPAPGSGGTGILPVNRPAPDSPRAGGDRGAPRAPIEQRGERQTTQEQGDHDTIGILALDAHGQLAGACSTSGLRFKVPGRVGDSPIIGHGLYVDPRHGAAVATGAGELVMGTCATFLTVELMRRGAAPLDAAAEALRRITDAYDPQPHHQVALIALAPGGAWASAALRRGFTAAVRTGRLNEHRRPDLVVLG